MHSLDVKITRAQRLLRMLEQDAPLLAIRVAPLAIERQHAAKTYAAKLTAHTRAELEKLKQARSLWEANLSGPQAAD